MTSQSIVGRNDFPDYDRLDAMIASALKKLLNTHVHFRKRVSVEEQRARKYDRFLRGRRIAHMIGKHFCATGAHEAVQGLSDLFNIRSQNDNVQDCDVRCDQALLSASDMPSDVTLEGLYQSNFSQLCSASDGLGFVRPTNCPKQWTTDLSKIEDICKTSFWSDDKKSKLQSEVVERGSVTKSSKGVKAYVERKVEECFQWKSHGQCYKGDSCSFGHEVASGNSAELRDEKDNRPLPHQIRRPRLTARETNLQ